MRSKLAASLAAALCVAVCGGASAAAVPVPGPDPSLMTLQAEDFPGAQATGQGDSDSYERVIRLVHPYGKSRYVIFDSTAIVAPDAGAGAALYRQLGHQLSQRQTRIGLIRQLLAQAGLAQAARAITLLKPRAVGVSDSSMEAGFVIKIAQKTLDVSLTLLRVDRVVDADLALGIGATVTRSDGVAVTTLAAGHIAHGLTPSGLDRPLLTGTAAAGQTLTASSGTWQGSATTFAYQWQRCDGAGANCADVPGATSVFYRVSPADAGATLRARVTATNRFGSGLAVSAVSAVVP